MPTEQWTAVDSYIDEKLVQAEDALAAALETTAAAGLPAISVSASQGKLLQLLVRSQQARRILEVGTLGGYSTIWMARALPPDGRLISLEADPKHAEVARANLARAGLSAVAEVRVGRAGDTLPKLAEEKLPPFDFVFIDADKASTADYFAWALKLSRLGALIVVDNVVRNGNLIDAQSSDVSVQGMRRFFEKLSKDSRVSATAIQTVGSKGYDGFALALVTKPDTTP